MQPASATFWTNVWGTNVASISKIANLIWVTTAVMPMIGRRVRSSEFKVSLTAECTVHLTKCQSWGTGRSSASWWVIHSAYV